MFSQVNSLANKKGFTIIELLVIMAIIGILSGIALVTMTSVRHKARGAYIAQTTKAIEQAFTMKGLSDQVTNWWQVGDFPVESEWEEVIDVQQLIEEAGLGEFLPTLPDGLPAGEPDDFGAAPYNFTIAYQNYFPTASEYTDPDPSVCYQENYTHTVSNFYETQNGVSLIIRPDYDYQTEKFKQTFEYLDDYFDDGDGQNCGRWRIITYPNWLAMFIYTMDTDEVFNF